jgi:hypothetical protein
MPDRSVKQLLKAAVPQGALNFYDRVRREMALSKAAKDMRALHRKGLPAFDCGPADAVELAANWLCRAQDQSTTRDGGVARHFSLNSGWSPSYPETTGYIVPTFIQLDSLDPDRGYGKRARRMLDWLEDIQMECGGFQGGMITSAPVPVTFNTGQILLGLAAGAHAFGSDRYLQAMHRAAIWLAESQDSDGGWRKFGTPFAEPGEKAYETHVAWGLLEADRVAPGIGYGEAGMRQIRWALAKMTPNGWLADCCLLDPARPLTHTLGYALRGIIEGYRSSDDPELLAAAELLGQGLMSQVDQDGRLAGRFDRDWRPAVDWVCLTGSVQIAASFLDLCVWTGDQRWREKALKLNHFVRRTIVTDGSEDIRGAIAGSFPIDGDYGRFEYPNWAAKFLIDSQLLEIAATKDENQM